MSWEIRYHRLYKCIVVLLLEHHIIGTKCETTNEVQLNFCCIQCFSEVKYSPLSLSLCNGGKGGGG